MAVANNEQGKGVSASECNPSGLLDERTQVVDGGACVCLGRRSVPAGSDFSSGRIEGNRARGRKKREGTSPTVPATTIPRHAMVVCGSVHATARATGVRTAQTLSGSHVPSGDLGARGEAGGDVRGIIAGDGGAGGSELSVGSSDMVVVVVDRSIVRQVRHQKKY